MTGSRFAVTCLWLGLVVSELVADFFGRGELALGLLMAAFPVMALWNHLANSETEARRRELRERFLKWRANAGD